MDLFPFFFSKDMESINKKHSQKTSKYVLNGKYCLSFAVLIIVFSTNFYSNKIKKNNTLPQLALLNRISGFVFDQNRNPLSDTYVELQDELYRTLVTVKTNSAGLYIFTGMSAGTFYVRAFPTGTDFIEQTIKVQITNLRVPGGNLGQSAAITQDFYLRSRKEDSDTPNYQAGVIFAQEIPDKAKTAYEKAVSQLEKKKSSEAIKFLEEAISIFPKYFIALNRLGYVYFEKAKYVKASEYFARAANVNRKSESTIFYLAYSVFITKRYDTTLTILESALAEDHTTSRIYLLFGKCYRIKKKFIDAERALKFAENLNTANDPEVHWELAKLYGNDLKKYDDAAKQLELFLKLQPKAKDRKQIRKLIQKFKAKAKTKNFVK